jgi:hypothetical protein
MKKLGTLIAISVIIVILVPWTADANSIEVNENAALTGTYGLEVNYNGSPSLAYVMSRNAGDNPHPWNDETGIKIRFVIDPGDLSGTSGTGHFNLANQGNVRIMNTFMDFTPGFGTKIIIFLSKSIPGDAWRLLCWVRSGTNGADGWVFGGGGYLTGKTPAWGTSTIVEVEWKADSSEGASDGYIKATRQQFTNPSASPVTIFNNTSLDNDDHRMNILRLGSISNAEVGSPEGYIKIDDFSITRLP